MRLTRRAVLGATATVGIAGCIGGDGGGSTETDGGESPADTPTASPTEAPTEAPTETRTTSGEAMATVRVRSHPDLGDILVDSAGMTLYMFDQDTRDEGMSTCSGDCANAWPPLTVDGSPTAGADVAAELTAFERTDGSMQVAAAGWPLYYFTSDESPGDANGQGVGGAWWVLDPDGSPVRSTGTPTATATSTSMDTGTETGMETETGGSGAGGY